MSVATPTRGSPFKTKEKQRTRATRSSRKDPAANPSSATEFQSKLLASLFDHIDASSRLTVFDVGPAIPQTVNFFAQYSCKLHFADLFAERIVRHQKNNSSETVMEKHFQRLLKFPENTQFDICLFWDFLNYLDAPALKAFSRALQPFLYRGTLGHAFGVLNANTPMLNQQYGIQGLNSIVVKARQQEQLICHPHPQAEIKKLFLGFDIGRGTLLPDGRLEMLLKSIT